MKCLKWNKSYELGIIEIDIQHRILFNILKILVDSVDQKREEDVIEGVLTEISRYTYYHAETEEKFFVKGTPETEEHIQEHDKFKEDILKFKVMYENQSDEELVEMMLLYLQSWIENHVTGLDRRDLVGN